MFYFLESGRTTSTNIHICAFLLFKHKIYNSIDMYISGASSHKHMLNWHVMNKVNIILHGALGAHFPKRECNYCHDYS